jgi:hypothetical protein
MFWAKEFWSSYNTSQPIEVVGSALKLSDLAVYAAIRYPPTLMLLNSTTGLLVTLRHIRHGTQKISDYKVFIN